MYVYSDVKFKKNVIRSYIFIHGIVLNMYIYIYMYIYRCRCTATI